MQWLAFLGRFFLLDFFPSIVTFPMWWYGDGLTSVIRWSKRTLAYRWQSYAFRIWAKNLLVPMYGQTDAFGHAISIVMRIVILVARMVGYVAELVGHGMLILAWAAWPMLLVLLLVFSIYQSLFGGLAA